MNYLYWRVYTDSTGNNHWSISSLEMRSISGGANVMTGGTLTASSTWNSYVASNMMDNDINTFWLTNLDMIPPHWVQYQFATPTTVTEVVITPRNDGYWGGEVANNLKFQGSNNGIDWVDVWTVTGITGWNQGTAKTFTNPSPPTTTTTQAPTTTTTQAPGNSMSTIIQIKRSTGSSAPTTSTLVEGELAYSEDRTNNGAGAILYIESVASDGTTEVIDKVGGKYYTNTVDTFLTPQTSSVGGKVVLKEATTNGSNKITLSAPASITTDVTYTLPASYTDGQYLKTDGSGNLSFAAIPSGSFGIAGDSGSDTFTTGDTLTFAGTANQISTAITHNTLTLALTNDVTLVGDLTVGGNDIKMNGGTTALTFSGSGDVKVANDLIVGNNHIKASDSTTALTLSASTGNVATAGDLKVGGNDIIASDGTTSITLSSADVAVAGDLTVTGNDIKMNGGTTALTFSGSGDVAVAGDIKIGGQDIKAADGTIAITLSSSTGNVAVAGDLKVGGNDISASDGTTALTLSATTGNVAVAGDLKVGGNDIQASDGTTALTLSTSTGNVTVAGDLKVGGNDILASDGQTAITLSGKNVTIAGDFTVNGTSTIVNSTTVAVGDALLKLAKDNAANSVDTGFYAEYVTSSTTKWSGLFRDASDSNKFKLFKDLTVEPTTTVDTSDASYAIGTLVANLTGGSISSLASAIGVADGGTGASTFTSNGVLYGNGTGAIQATAAGTNGYFLYSNSGTPAWTNTIDGGTY